MSIPDFPFRRDIRPVTPEGLGEHVDRQFEKIEAALYNLNLTGGSGGSGSASWAMTLLVEGGSSTTAPTDYLLRLDFGKST